MRPAAGKTAPYRRIWGVAGLWVPTLPPSGRDSAEGRTVQADKLSPFGGGKEDRWLGSPERASTTLTKSVK
jgi:hypothetical protein